MNMSSGARACARRASVRAGAYEDSPVGSFASEDLDICLRNVCGSFTEHCGDLRRLSFSPVK